MNKRQNVRKGLILSSFFIFPAVFYYLSPVLILEASAEGIINGSFTVFMGLSISALVLGRGYCGWVCPAAGCQEAMFLARNKKVTKGDLIKWMIWVPWTGAIAVLAVRSGGYREVDLFYRTTHGLSIGDIQSFVTYLIVLLLLIVLPGFLVGRRSFCHHLCWMAPFMIIGRSLRNLVKWPSLRLKAESAKCLHCHRCTEHCPMSLPVEDMVERNRVENKECILCGTCADGCQEKAISLVFRSG
jgi:ferredoxin-type protein NapH